MIDFSNRTTLTLLIQMLAGLPNNIDRRDGSLIKTALALEAAELATFYDYLNAQQLEFSAFTATGEALDYKAAERGVIRKSATATVIIFQSDAPLPVGTRVATVNGVNTVVYVVTVQSVLQDGFYAFKAICETLGAAGNDTGDGTLQLVTYAADVTTVEFVGIYEYGIDEETDDALRARYIEALQSRPFAGNAAAYRSVVLNTQGVGAMQIYGGADAGGGGNVVISLVDANYTPVSDDIIATVKGTVAEVTPIGATVTVVTPATQDVIVALNVPAGTTKAQQATLTANITQAVTNSRSQWGTPQDDDPYEYQQNLIIGNIYAAAGSISVTNITINGATTDFDIPQTYTAQPIFGAVTVNITVAGG